MLEGSGRFRCSCKLTKNQSESGLGTTASSTGLTVDLFMFRFISCLILIYYMIDRSDSVDFFSENVQILEGKLHFSLFSFP